MGKAKSWEEYKLECEVVAKEGITILGFVEPWKGARTKLICYCEKHGEWSTTQIHSFKLGVSCPGCKAEGVSHRLINKNYARKKDSFHIEEFIKTGDFKIGTKFWRSQRKNKYGWQSYWNYTCPVCSNDEYVKAGVCSGVFEGGASNLKRGQFSCRCAKNYRYTKEQWDYRLKKECKERGYEFINWKNEKFGVTKKFIYSCPLHGEKEVVSDNFLKGNGCPLCAGNSQKDCYINLIRDKNVAVGIKFGMAKDSSKRLYKQNWKNLFQMSQIGVWEFKSVEDCKNAEKECKSTLKCGVLTSRELKDGYTESVALTDYDEVVRIYESWGGVRIK